MVMNKPIDILLFFAVWGRGNILKVCIEGIKELSNYKPSLYNIIPFAIYSTEEDRVILDNAGINSVYHPNEFLGAKKNYGLAQALRIHKFEYMLEIGSDDVLNPKLLDLYLPYLIDGYDMLSVDAFHMIDTETGMTSIFQSDLIIGGGRMIKREILERMYKVPFTFTVSAAGPDLDVYPRKKDYLTINSAVNYEKIGYGTRTGEPEFVLWKHNLQIGLDTDSHWNILLSGKVKQHQFHIEDPYVIDLKSEVNIHPFSNFEPLYTSADDLLVDFPKPVVRKILQLFENPDTKKRIKK
jgi:hypothetical protein